jgi:hypothetical protein
MLFDSFGNGKCAIWKMEPAPKMHERGVNLW